MGNGKPKIRANKRAIWLKHYLNEDCPRTFFNATASAKAAGYRCSSEESFRTIGNQNLTKLYAIIERWFDEQGLSENTLKIKMVSLLNAKETKFFSHQGVVTDSREVEALEIQRRTLDMILRVKGMYAPEKYEQADGSIIVMTHVPEPKPLPKDIPQG